jgi:hypothetical protein
VLCKLKKPPAAFNDTNVFKTEVLGHTARAQHMAEDLSPGVGIESAIERPQAGRFTKCTTRSLHL